MIPRAHMSAGMPWYASPLRISGAAGGRGQGGERAGGDRQGGGGREGRAAHAAGSQAAGTHASKQARKRARRRARRRGAPMKAGVPSVLWNTSVPASKKWACIRRQAGAREAGEAACVTHACSRTTSLTHRPSKRVQEHSPADDPQSFRVPKPDHTRNPYSLLLSTLQPTCPKSAILTSPDPASSTLSGFMSPCTCGDVGMGWGIEFGD